MPNLNANHNTTFDVALFDGRPFFEVALLYGIKNAILTKARIATLETEAPKGLVQIAELFGSKYLRPEIETARQRIVNLASLYLLETSQGNLEIAAKLIRDNTFLTLSRGGSGLLKAVFALPEYAMLGREQKERVEDFLEAWSLKNKPQEYRNLLAQRQANALEIEAARWFAETLELTQAELQEDDIEAGAVIRTAMLMRWIDQADRPIENQIEFATILDGLRRQLKSKAKAKQLTSDAAEKKCIASDIPEKYRELATHALHEIWLRDVPRIQDASLSLDRLVYELKERYFICDNEMEDTSEYDALVSKEWAKITKGKTDIDSLTSLLFCIAVDMPPKTSLSEKAAKTVIKKIREHGFHSQLAITWITTHAPHEKQEGLLEDWQNFADEVPTYLMDDWYTDYTGALRFLSENCHIDKPKKK